jgi:peptide/nickel transport system ATP-binding protein
MKQRMVIAMALAADPVLLIADEATSNLDVTIQAQILDLMRKLKETIVSALLFITHDLGVVAEICDRVGVMYAGTLCEVTTVETLFTQPVHPYTRALLNSVPKLTDKGELTTVFGSVPDLVNPPSGCRFHPRCRIAGHLCKDRKPRLVNISGTHQVACHHWEKSE